LNHTWTSARNKEALFYPTLLRDGVLDFSIS